MRCLVCLGSTPVPALVYWPRTYSWSLSSAIRRWPDTSFHMMHRRLRILKSTEDKEICLPSLQPFRSAPLGFLSAFLFTADGRPVLLPVLAMLSSISYNGRERIGWSREAVSLGDLESFPRKGQPEDKEPRKRGCQLRFTMYPLRKRVCSVC